MYFLYTCLLVGFGAINTYLMELKAVKYHTKSKKLRPTALTDYETLRASIKKVFPKGLDEDFVIYYFEDGEPFDVETQ